MCCKQLPSGGLLIQKFSMFVDCFGLVGGVFFALDEEITTLLQVPIKPYSYVLTKPSFSK